MVETIRVHAACLLHFLGEERECCTPCFFDLLGGPGSSPVSIRGEVSAEDRAALLARGYCVGSSASESALGGPFALEAA